MIFTKYSNLSNYGIIGTRPVVEDVKVTPGHATDADLRKISFAFPAQTPRNVEYAFWEESAAQSWAYITYAAIMGGGEIVPHVKVKTNREKAERIIIEFNKDINYSHQSFNDYVRDHWFDTMIHGGSFWRVLLTKDRAFGVDIGRVDPLTIIKEITEPELGARLFIQQANSWSEKYTTADEFYEDYDPLKVPAHNTVWIKIPNEPESVIRVKHFPKAPAASALKYMVYKLWILYFMRKFSEKYWAPLLIGLIGEPGKFVPRRRDMKAISTKLDEVFKNIHLNSSLTLPGYVRILTVQPNMSGRAGQVYIDVMNMIDKQIMLALMSSMAMREASGNEMATQRGIKEIWEMAIKQVRIDINSSWIPFYTNVLLPANGITNVKTLDLELEWPKPMLDPLIDISNSLVNLGTAGILDKKEARTILRKNHMPDLAKENDGGEIKVANQGFNTPGPGQAKAP